jgi:hypothetical protein
MQNDFIHENGGQMIVHMNGLGSRYGLYGSLDNHYGNIVTLASGGHLSAWASVRGAYTPFAVRFSKFIWDPNLKRVSAENMLSVKADKPLWFEKFVKIIDNGKSRIVVAHLINPPLGKSPSSRTPAEGNALVSINIPDGYTMRKAWWAVPEPDVTLKSLEFKKRESLSEIRIPPFWTWGMIVVEMKRDPEGRD